MPVGVSAWAYAARGDAGRPPMLLAASALDSRVEKITVIYKQARRRRCAYWNRRTTNSDTNGAVWCTPSMLPHGPPPPLPPPPVFYFCPILAPKRARSRSHGPPLPTRPGNPASANYRAFALPATPIHEHRLRTHAHSLVVCKSVWTGRSPPSAKHRKQLTVVGDGKTPDRAAGVSDVDGSA